MDANDLFKQLGLDGLSDEAKAGLSEDLGEVAMNRIADRLESLLTPEQAAEFEAELKTDEATAYALLKGYIPDYQSIIREELEQLRAEVIGTHDDVMKKLGQMDDE